MERRFSITAAVLCVPTCCAFDAARTAHVQDEIVLVTHDFSTDPHPFTFKYDPEANSGVGRIAMSIDDKMHTLDLHPKQRAAGIKFNRFGLMNIRRGGKYVTVYLDDLSYTSRHPTNYQPIKHEQAVVHVPYPRNGRTY